MACGDGCREPGLGAMFHRRWRGWPPENEPVNSRIELSEEVWGI